MNKTIKEISSEMYALDLEIYSMKKMMNKAQGFSAETLTAIRESLLLVRAELTQLNNSVVWVPTDDFVCSD